MTTQKYGVEILEFIADAKQLDEENGNTFWMYSLTKEMSNVYVAFHILDRGGSPPLGTRKHKDTWFGM